MECMCEMLPYPHPPQAHAFYHQQSAQQQHQPQPPIYNPYLQQPQHIEEHYLSYGSHDYADFRFAPGPYYEDLEDSGEVSTRPRLTKEQVEVLEAEFQANHKPSSMQKRQLARQTMLSLPRVANWFQNRRAKAKQQKKLEEYENSQALEANQNSNSDDEDSQDTVKAETENSSHESPRSSNTRPSISPDSAASQEAEQLRQSRLASYASVDRLLAVQSAQQQQPFSPYTAVQKLEPPSEAPMNVGAHHRSMSTASRSQIAQWPRKPELLEAWTEHPQHFQDTSFDFGFSTQHPSHQVQTLANINTTFVEDSAFHNSMLPPDSWPQAMAMPAPTFHDHPTGHDSLQSPGLPLPAYPESRRGSGTESLAANFGSFALGTPVQETPAPIDCSELSHPDGQLDLAARRKRPRPAALTSASLRSRSYGALTATSPTIRSGFTPPIHAVRHVKSTGHSLNARYAGIRKPSSAQRSPLNVSTFADAESFKILLAQQAGELTPLSASTTRGNSTPVASTSGLTIDTRVNDNVAAWKAELARNYQLAASQHLTLSTSPPSTPFAPGYNAHGQFSVPPVSAPPQYASFTDNTPPYSAGPMTNSSWPDAPLTSPEMPNFPTNYLPPLPTINLSNETGMHNYPNFVIPSDGKTGFDGTDSNPETKQTEFYIQEFPNQREEHAHIAQKLPNNKPKNYVFANSAPGDYDQS